MKRISTAFLIYLTFCSALAFVDFDWDAENEQAAKSSIYKQTLYMNNVQRQAYIDDLETIHSAGMMGGVNGRRLHGNEASDIHDLANQIRQKTGRNIVEFPSKPFGEAISSFFKIPFILLINK
ncbi:hypothetical protein D9M09_08850 [Janthinobacterium agaricidamnosum]|uniref:DUF4148 domain-containing protein n=1 Tax=Janthinobacterium agaricidamnosum TaxID=55508 RepID=A0A3G2E7W5_9BURK|nr:MULTISPECIES: hypothetical protein [Janthinobacterium]AYM75890.1 hypothetical protein D9M09_08850 [Janthinobacterium agaricidamnosum]OEZ89511.1 hypothetical protein JAB8_25140 [Janthinobacterium sp. HH106]